MVKTSNLHSLRMYDTSSQLCLFKNRISWKFCS